MDWLTKANRAQALIESYQDQIIETLKGQAESLKFLKDASDAEVQEIVMNSPDFVRCLAKLAYLNVRLSELQFKIAEKAQETPIP